MLRDLFSFVADIGEDIAWNIKRMPGRVWAGITDYQAPVIATPFYMMRTKQGPHYIRWLAQADNFQGVSGYSMQYEAYDHLSYRMRLLEEKNGNNSNKYLPVTGLSIYGIYEQDTAVGCLIWAGLRARRCLSRAKEQLAQHENYLHLADKGYIDMPPSLGKLQIANLRDVMNVRREVEAVVKKPGMAPVPA